MSIFSGSTEIKSIYSGSTEVQEVYSGSDLVWVNLPKLTIAQSDWPTVIEDTRVDVTFASTYLETEGEVGGISFTYDHCIVISKDLLFPVAGTYRFTLNVTSFFRSNWDGFIGRWQILRDGINTSETTVSSTGDSVFEVALNADEIVNWRIRSAGGSPASADGYGYIRWNNFRIEKVS